MKVKTYSDAAAFLAVAEAPLLKDEAKNNLILSIAERVGVGTQFGEQAPLFLTVDDGGTMIAAAMRTPPFNVIVHCEDGHHAALEGLVDHLLKLDPELPGANGEAAVVSAFSQIWSAKKGVSAKKAMSQRVYALREVLRPEGVLGAMRWATRGDLEIVIKWIGAFHDEAVPDNPKVSAQKIAERFITSGKLAIWDRDGPVSVAGSSRGTKNSATVSFVYTPPEHRGNGYASACVAALSQVLLDEGNRFCILFTDLSNPTSNKIYQNIGYRTIADFAMYTFTEPGADP
jgi:predicted GNAT family acetyltransferase